MRAELVIGDLCPQVWLTAWSGPAAATPAGRHGADLSVNLQQIRAPLKSYDRTVSKTAHSDRTSSTGHIALDGETQGGGGGGQEACSRYSLTIEEFLSWQLRLAQHGLVGLQTKKIKHHRLKLRTRHTSP